MEGIIFLIHSIISNVAPGMAVVLILVVLFFQMVDRGLIKIGRNMSLGARMDELTRYANHETTDKLDKILQSMDGLRDSMRDHNKLDEKVITLLEEQKEYGVRIRKD